MTKLLTYFLLISFLSCNNKVQDEVKTDENHKKAPELNIAESDSLNLTELLADNPFELNISSKNLTEFPDLSSYEIHSLNVSNNKIKSIPQTKLPKKLRTLIANNNGITNFKLSNSIDALEKIDLSNNELDTFYVYKGSNKIILNNNNLVYVKFFGNNINYLDISNNPNLNNVVDFFPRGIDTILRNNILNKKPLYDFLQGKDGVIIIKD
ncbi:leucine-rich repeat domain-containing protein [Psychroserpens luteus]|uniref:Leucine rich repeat-containing protein n=1 Tax=Psychroserpens luteus TaxID=1434066 RepID=A0ABW5ZR55_9FLAO|nr:hypothetical protein [Psychroserpens luteus]